MAGICVAGYTAFLFGQAEGRDLWQSPLYLWHLLAAAVTAGASALILAGVIDGTGREVIETLARVLAMGAAATGLLSVAEIAGRHPTADAARAAHELAFGRFRLWFWLGGVLLGALLPLGSALLYLNVDTPSAVILAGAVAALAGLAASEWAWVEAGQVVPLS